MAVEIGTKTNNLGYPCVCACVRARARVCVYLYVGACVWVGGWMGGARSFVTLV